MAAFDGADPSFVTGIRDETNVPTQALQLLNDDFVVGRADALARQILQDPRSDAQNVREVFRRTLGRDPTAAEQRSSTSFMQDVSRLHTKDDAFESLESPDQQSLSRLRRLAPNAGQELLERSMREAGIAPEQADRVRQLLEAEELPRAVERQLNRLRRQGIERNDPRFPTDCVVFLTHVIDWPTCHPMFQAVNTRGRPGPSMPVRRRGAAWPKRCSLLLISCTDPKETRHGTVLQSNPIRPVHPA